jgi:hypothetical protein
MTEIISNKLNDILIFCSKHRMIFTFQKEGEVNFIDISNDSEKKVVINICNIDDENLNNLLDEKIEELNQLFKD